MMNGNQETIEEVVEKLESEYGVLGNDFSNGFYEGIEWQEQRMYSEEEVGELLYNVIGEYGKHYGIMIDGKMLNDLFEEFKKT